MLLAGLLVIVMLPTAAMAQEDQYPTPSTTVTTHQCESGNSNSEVCGTVVTVPRGSSSLPFTGENVALLTVLGLVAAAAGVGLVWVGRRPDSNA